MLFVATLKHSPDNCWAREENKEKAREWINGITERAAEHRITLHGSFAAPNEHTLYFIVEADSFNEVSEFLGPPFLQDHTGDIVPVLTVDEVEEAVLQD